MGDTYEENASADVLEEAENAGVGLEFYKVAAEALIFITPAENTADSITLEQIREIYLRYGITNWSELADRTGSSSPSAAILTAEANRRWTIWSCITRKSPGHSE